MKKYNQQKLAMYNVVRQLMEENATTWNSIPAVDSVFNDFTAKIVELEELGMKQGSKIAGYAVSKSKLRLLTIEQAESIAGALVVYAKSISDDVLKAKVTLSATTLKRATKEQLLARLDEISQLATDLSAELVPYGISTAGIDAFNNKVESLKEQMYRVRMEIVKRKQLTSAIVKITQDADDLLTTGLDLLMKSIRSIDAKFYEKYKSARMIIEHGVKHKLPPSNKENPKGFLGA